MPERHKMLALASMHDSPAAYKRGRAHGLRLAADLANPNDVHTQRVIARRLSRELVGDARKFRLGVARGLGDALALMGCGPQLGDSDAPGGSDPSLPGPTTVVTRMPATAPVGPFA